MRLVSITYSRISLRDIALKLHSPSEEEVEINTFLTDLQLESLIAQAISDGILKGSIVNGTLLTQPTSDVYTTTEPQRTLTSRTRFCLKTKGAAQNSLRYPQETYTEGLVSTQPSSIEKKEENNEQGFSKGEKSKKSQNDSDVNSENDEDEEDSMILGGGDVEDDDGFDGQDFI